MRSMKNNGPPLTSRPWQARWWKEDGERGRWAGTIAIVFVLMGAFAFQNPLIWQQNTPSSLAQQENIPEPAPEQPQIQAAQATPQPEINSADSGVEVRPLPTAEQPQTIAQAQPTPAQSGEDRDPDGSERQQLEPQSMAVSTPPISWQQPAFGSWSRPYGYGLDPTLGDFRFHKGRDMDLEIGAPVFAVAAGRIALAAEDTVWGGLVVVEHGGGWVSTYKCLQPTVTANSPIAAGEQLGLVLASPPGEKGQPSHLHFELSLDGENQDPAQWL